MNSRLSDDASWWRLTAPEALHWRRWDDELVLYNAASGDTHILEPLGAEVLQLLQRSPATVMELVEGLAAGGAREPDRDVCQYVDALVTQFHRLGVVEPA